MASNESLESRLADRLKNSEIGSLIPEEDLFDITKKAVELAFFAPVNVPDPHDRYRSIQKPSLVVTMAADRLQEAVQAAVAQVIREEVEKNPQLINDILDKVFAEGAETVILKAVVGPVVAALHSTIGEPMRVAMRMTLVNAGLVDPNTGMRAF